MSLHLLEMTSPPSHVASSSHGVAECDRKPLEIKGTGLQHAQIGAKLLILLVPGAEPNKDTISLVLHEYFFSIRIRGQQMCQH